MKENPLSFHLNLKPEDFLPATEEEKQSQVIMRESVSFWKDGMRRLLKNKVAMVSAVVILIVMIFSFIVPAFYPYTYDHQIKGANNLKPMEYSEEELIDAENIVISEETIYALRNSVSGIEAERHSLEIALASEGFESSDIQQPYDRFHCIVGGWRKGFISENHPENCRQGIVKKFCCRAVILVLEHLSADINLAYCSIKFCLCRSFC